MLIAPAPAAAQPSRPQPPPQRQPQLLPSASAPVLFRPPDRPKIVEPDMDDGGIEYVANFRLRGSAAVGETLSASADFVGKGEAFWSRVPAGLGEGAAAEGTPISGADGFSYIPTADDVDCYLRVTCTSSVGGDASSLTTPATVRPQPPLAAELERAAKKADKVGPSQPGCASTLLPPRPPPQRPGPGSYIWASTQSGAC